MVIAAHARNSSTLCLCWCRLVWCLASGSMRIRGGLHTSVYFTTAWKVRKQVNGRNEGVEFEFAKCSHSYKYLCERAPRHCSTAAHKQQMTFASNQFNKTMKTLNALKLETMEKNEFCQQKSSGDPSTGWCWKMRKAIKSIWYWTWRGQHLHNFHDWTLQCGADSTAIYST